jgi:hypothetical protein
MELFKKIRTPRFPDITPCDVFLCGYVKDLMFLLPFLRSFEEMKENLAAALTATVSAMLQKVWDESDYRINVSYTYDTRGSYWPFVR